MRYEWFIGLRYLKAKRKQTFVSLITVISVVGFTFVGLASGTEVTETVFSLPGIGRLVVESVLRRDYPVIQGVILIIAVAYMIVNLMIDCCYTFLDPRIRVS